MHINRLFRRVLPVLLIVLLPGIQVAADGGFFPALKSVAVSVDQRAIIVRKGSRTSMILSTGYTGNGDDFAWIIPIPVAPKAGDVKETGEAGEGAFEILDTITAVKVPTRWFNPTGVRGSRDDRMAIAPVIVLGRVSLEHYEASILSSGNAAALTEWLQRNGYAMDASALPVLESYIERHWSFVAVKLAPGAQRDYMNEFLPAILITYRSPDFVFPLRISAVSTLDEVRITLYVVTDSTVSTENYATVQFVPGDRLFEREKPEEYVEASIRDSLGDTGQGLVRMWSGAYQEWLYDAVRADMNGEGLVRFYEEDYALEDLTGIVFGKGRFLTRLEARMAPAAMVKDIRFALDPQPVEFGDRPGLALPR